MKRKKLFLIELVIVCLICFIVAMISMFMSSNYLINYSGITDSIKPEAYKDYQD